MPAGTLLILGSGDQGTTILRLLGRLHPAVVHFPIALLTVAAVLETWQIVRRKPALSAATPVCLILGAVSAIAASAFGWFLDEFDGGGGETVDLHKWIGIATTVVALLAAILLIKASTSGGVRMAFRLVLFAGAALAGGTGFLGGELVFGKGHLFKGILDNKEPPASASTESHVLATDQQPAPTGKVDFTRDIAPILTENCFRCHGGEKVKGKLNLKTRAGALKGGSQQGAGLVPGDPAKSAIYTALITTDADARMPPPKEKQLTKEQIASIRQWIEQGGAWPEGATLR